MNKYMKEDKELVERRKEIIGSRLREALKLRDKSRKELASYIGVAPNTVSMYISSNQMPREEKIYKMSKYLDVSPEWLTGEIDEMIEIEGKDIKKYSEEIVNLFSSLNSKYRERVLDHLRLLSQLTECTKERNDKVE